MQDNGAAPNGLTFDNDKALKVSKELHAARKEKRGVFIKGVRAPEDVLPNRMVRGSREHALYLFHSAPLTPRARSEDMYHWLRRLYETKPEMFDPEHVRSLSMAEVSKSIKSFLPHGDADVAMWCENSLKLENYGDNPVNICGDERDVTVAYKRLQDFRGFGPKVTPLLIGWYDKYGFSEFNNKYELRIPVDVWVIDLSIGQGILGVKNHLTRRERVEDFLRENYYEFFKRHVGIDSFEYQELLWNVGAYACNFGPCGKLCPFEDPCIATIEREKYMHRAIIKINSYNPTKQRRLF